MGFDAVVIGAILFWVFNNILEGVVKVPHPGIPTMLLGFTSLAFLAFAVLLVAVGSILFVVGLFQ